MASTSRTRIVNHLPQKLPIVLHNTATKQLEHSYLPAKGSRIVYADEVSESLRGLARKGKVELIDI
jgi:siroheme synthase (precorrin-2 oxidase/ferrochelatase)